MNVEMVTRRRRATRSGTAVLAGGVLLALLQPGTAAAGQDPLPDEVSGGYASWAVASAGLADHGVSLEVEEPAVRGAADRAWFPAEEGGADLGTGDAEVGLAGTARLTGSTDPAAAPLDLTGLRLRIDDGEGALYVRTGQDGAEAGVALAGLRADGAEHVVRAGGMTWSGLRASLTADGARLLSDWSGRPFTEGDALGRIDVTLGTGGAVPGAPGEPDGVSPSQPPTDGATPAPDPGQEAGGAEPAAPTASVGQSDVAAGAEQSVVGEGFEPGEVVLVAIDDDTRYQAVADGSGRVSRAFPVYATATEGSHTAELYSVSGDRRAAVGFHVRPVG